MIQVQEGIALVLRENRLRNDDETLTAHVYSGGIVLIDQHQIEIDLESTNQRVSSMRCSAEIHNDDTSNDHCHANYR